MFNPDSIALMGLFFSIVSCFMNVMILFMLSRLKIANSRDVVNEMMLRFLLVMGCVMVLLFGIMTAAIAENEDNITVLDDKRPLIFPDPGRGGVGGAASALVDLIDPSTGCPLCEDMAWWQSALIFLGNNSFNNSTHNITA